MSDRPRLLATDLDGTLLRSDHEVSERTRTALQAAEDAGVLTVFVTGRPPRLLDHLADVVGAHGTAICGNGAFVYDVASGTVTETHPFEAEVLEQIVVDLQKAVPGIEMAGEGVLGRQSPPFAGDPVAKFLARKRDVAIDVFRRQVMSVVGDRGELAVSENSGLAELSAPGVTKASALATFAGERGWGASEVWAVGDMPNDIPMLRWAGRAFAVANAHSSVQAIVDEVVPSNDDDGVATLLERMIDA